MAIIKVLHHPHIIRYYETFQTKETIYIACEYMRDGQLFDYIVEKTFMEEYEASFVFEQLLSIVNYLHNSSIIHRDLKPENIMIEREQQSLTDDKTLGKIKLVKLIDFGFACYVSDSQQMDEPVGTPNYVAPEVFLGNYDEKADNFALGTILYFM